MASLLSALKESFKTEQSTQHVAPLYTLINPSTKFKSLEENVSNIIEDNEYESVNQFKSLQDLSKELELYAEKSKKVVCRKRKQHSESESILKPFSSYVTEGCITSALRKCNNNESFWSVVGLKSLISNHYITQASHAAMFDCIFKYNSIDVLETLVLNNYKISEKYLIQSIKHIVRSVQKTEIEQLSLTLMWESCPVKENIAKELCYVIAFEFDEIYMKEQMKLLNADEALVLIQFLHYILYIESPALISDVSTDIEVSKHISESKILSWLDALLTTQLMIFATSPSLKDLISQLNKTITRQKQFYRDVSKLAPYLKHLKKNYTLPKKSVGKYTIETVTL